LSGISPKNPADTAFSRNKRATKTSDVVRCECCEQWVVPVICGYPIGFCLCDDMLCPKCGEVVEN
jgi:hypothetical protein